MSLAIAEETRATTTLAVTVTHEHIRRGDRFCWDSCAVALALIDLGFRTPVVTYEPRSRVHVRCEIEGVPAHFHGDADMADWLYRFDRGESVAPERFLLRSAD
jgi:hypothetical protein